MAARGPLTGERTNRRHLCDRRRLLAGRFILAGRSLELFELKLHLVEQPRLALAARSKKLTPHLLDREPQVRDQSLRARRLRMRLRKLGIAGANQALQCLNIIRKRITSTHR